VLVSTSVIDTPVWAAVLSPVTDELAVVSQLKVVPETLFDVLSVTPTGLPEQIVCGFGVATAIGNGFTVTVTLIGAPGHVPAVGVTV